MSRTRRHRSPRFWRAVYAADRAAHSRAASVFRDSALHASLAQIRDYEPAGIVLSGGPCSVYDAGRAALRSRPCSPWAFPMLGICYGLQWIAHTLGGNVQRAERREYGPADLELRDGSPLFAGLSAAAEDLDEPRRPRARAAARLPCHRRDAATSLSAAEDPRAAFSPCNFIPKCGTPSAAPKSCAILSLAFAARSPTGAARPSLPRPWKPSASRWASERALCALSGGVDSAVAAALVHRAIGDRLTNVFVDNGVLRKDEFRGDDRAAEKRVGLKVIGVDAARAIPGASSRASPTRRTNASASARSSSPCLPTRPGELRHLGDDALPGAGNPLSRRDRIGGRARPLGDHQVAS